MAICSYLVIPEDGAAARLARRLAALPGCDVARAANRELIVLVADAPGRGEATALRERIEGMDGVRALVLTFGDIDPEAPAHGPPTRARRRRRAGHARHGPCSTEDARPLPVVGGRALPVLGARPEPRGVP